MSDALFTRIFRSHYIQWATPTFTSQTIDADNDGCAWVFEAPNTEAITHVGFRVASVTGTVTNLCKARLEGVSTTNGTPSGSDLGTTETTFTPGSAGSWTWLALANSYTPANRGALIAFTLRGQTGLGPSDNFAITTRDGVGAVLVNRPYSVHLTAGSWGTIGTTQPVFAIRTANTRYGLPYEAAISSRSSTTVGNRYAMYFTVPSGWCSTFKVLGFNGNASPAGAAGKAPLIGIWNAAGTVQGTTKALDSDQFGSVTSDLRESTFYFDDSTLPTLDAGTEYYIGFESADAASGGATIRGIELSEDNDKLCFAGGTNIGTATWNGSAWTKDTTTYARPMMELILSDITPPAGGGGGMLVHPGMGGRLI